jgi:CelD/BcsL family acetyltransferase involved in cellulose biosynthesis
LHQLYSFDPTRDERWEQFLHSRENASVFHTPGWLEAIRRTYRYEPVVFTTTAPGKPLTDALVGCKISTWLSKRRFVSVPFSDHTALLIGEAEIRHCLLSALKKNVDDNFYKYVEIRPISSTDPTPMGFGKSATFYSHKVDLRRSEESVYGSFHKSCVQRTIRRVERNAIRYTEGHSDNLIQQFYELLLLTHRRHGLPPQPILWFKNLSECMGENFKIRVASVDEVPIASIITLTDNRSMVYKYGCSDAKYHRLGGMTFLLWRAIQEAMSKGLDEFDMGRSDCDNRGLIRFKENWGAVRSTLVYWGYPAELRPNQNHWLFRAGKNVVSMLPTIVLPPAGKFLYRHFG